MGEPKVRFELTVIRSRMPSLLKSPGTTEALLVSPDWTVTCLNVTCAEARITPAKMEKTRLKAYEYRDYINNLMEVRISFRPEIVRCRRKSPRLAAFR